MQKIFNRNLIKHHKYLRAIGKIYICKIYMVTKLFMPLEFLPNQGLRKKAQCKTLAFYQEKLHKRFSSSELPGENEEIWIMKV